MGLRESLNKNPKVGLIVVGVVVICGIVFAAVNLKSDTPAIITNAFYTTDDGKTWFVDTLDRIPPFKQGDKVAVRAKVFVCSNDGKQFVGYLEQYAPEYKKRLDDSAAAVAAGRPATFSRSSPELAMHGTEVKRPGDAKWVSATDLIAKSKVTNVSCPSGGVLDSVVP